MMKQKKKRCAILAKVNEEQLYKLETQRVRIKAQNQELEGLEVTLKSIKK